MYGGIEMSVINGVGTLLETVVGPRVLEIRKSGELGTGTRCPLGTQNQRRYRVSATHLRFPS